MGEQKLSYMPQPTNPDIVAAIEQNTNAVAVIAASIATNGSSIDPATAENTTAIAAEITRATSAESANATAIALNTAKAGLNAAQETVLGNTSGSNSGDQDISGITSNATAIALNSAKTGLSSAQETVLDNTSGNNSGDQDISGITSNATAIALNTSKTGITSGQASAITANTAKVGLSSAQETVLGNTSGNNSGDQDISGIATNATNIGTNVTAIGVNTTKTGITSGQASAITANTAKTGLSSAQATVLGNTSGNNSGDQDLSSYATNTNLALKATIVSPAFTGTPSLPTGTIGITQTAGNNSTAIATTAFVSDALSSAPTGATNIAGLTDALIEDNSIYIGYDPSATTNTAQYNVSLGITALDAITTGDQNVAMGYKALTANTSGVGNTAVGNESLRDHTTQELAIPL